MLTLFLTLLILISVGGAVSIVGAASHVNPGQVSKPTATATTCQFIGNAHTHVYHYPGCPDVDKIKPENKFVSTRRAMQSPPVTGHANTVTPEAVNWS